MTRRRHPAFDRHRRAALPRCFALRAIMAQRLSSAICPNCRQPAELGESEMPRVCESSRVQLRDAQVMQGKGCEQCRGTGYKGRMGIFDIFLFSTTKSATMINKRKCDLCRRRVSAPRAGHAHFARRRRPPKFSARPQPALRK